MKLFSKLFAGAALVASTFAATAQDGPQLTISGSVDAYFRTNTVATNGFNGVGGAIQSPATSFAGGTGFNLGMANLVLGVEGEKSGFVADLVFGPRGNDAVFGSTDGSSPIVNQLYAYWNVSDAATLTIGNFNTFLGYEVISPTANFNYSTSYMFSYGPFSHTGLKLDYAFNEDLSGMISVMNPTDMTETNFVDTYTIGAQLGYKGVYLNLLYGDQTGSKDDTKATTQIDLTAGFDVTDEFYVGVNATYNTTATDVEGADPAGFYGAAAYLQYSLTDAFALGVRAEYFMMYNGGLIVEEEDGTLVSPVGYDVEGDGSVFDITLSAPYKVGDLTIIPEVRLDVMSEDYFVDSDLMPTKNLSSFTLAAVYAF